MKKILLPLLMTALMVACTKKTTNNYTTAIYALPSFTVNGLHDVSLQNGSSSLQYLQIPITVQYTDSAQGPVTLSLSGVPSGIAIDTTWVKTGIPTFETYITLYDTTAAGATPGSYPLTLTATAATGAQKTYPFTLKVLPVQSCTQYIVGKYNSCNTSCGSSFYTDSVYADPNTVNKIWLVNFNNTGTAFYATYNCNTEQLTMPTQVHSGITYTATGVANGNISSHFISLNVLETTSSGTVNCNTSME